MGKTTVTTTLTIAGAFSYTLSFWGDKNLYLLLLLYLLRLSLLFWTTLCFLYLDIRSRVECRIVLSFDWVTSSDHLPLNDFVIPTLLHCSPDISFALFSLALSCSWEVLQDMGSDHLPVLLTAPLSPVFRRHKRFPSLNFRKARRDDFAFYFDSHCPCEEEYSSLFLFLSCCSLYFSATECPPYDLVLWTALFLSFLAKTALAYLPTASLWHRGYIFLFSRPSMLKFFRQSLRHSTCSLLVFAAPTSLPFLFSSYLPLALSLLPCSLLHLSFISAETVFSLLQFYQAAMDPRTLVFPGRRRGWCAGQTGSATCALCNPL